MPRRPAAALVMVQADVAFADLEGFLDTRQLRPLLRRAVPAALGPPNKDLRPTPHQRRQSKKEIVRCLKRYIAREIYQLLNHTNTIARLTSRASLPSRRGAIAAHSARVGHARQLLCRAGRRSSGMGGRLAR